MFAIPFMEISAPAADAALDTSPRAFRAFYDDALPRVYGYSFIAAAARFRWPRT